MHNAFVALLKERHDARCAVYLTSPRALRMNTSSSPGMAGLSISGEGAAATGESGSIHEI